jgi:beta-glucosidase
LFDDYSDGLVLNIASQCSNTIVSIHNAGPRIADAWIEHPNVTAVIFAHTPGQESGNALVEVIYGKQSPSGRMPYTLAKQESDYCALLRPSLPDQKNPMLPQSDFTEGLNIDVRDSCSARMGHDADRTNSTKPSSPIPSPLPRFAFGYGLTYSNFTYTSLHVSKNSTSNVASSRLTQRTLTHRKEASHRSTTSSAPSP